MVEIERIIKLFNKINISIISAILNVVLLVYGYMRLKSFEYCIFIVNLFGSLIGGSIYNFV